MSSVLEGVRIIDATQAQLGPIATSMLAMLGAEVIHIEEPTTGDMSRGIKYMSGIKAVLETGSSIMFEISNRGKKSVLLNLRKEESREVVHKLAEKSDVFVHNFRPGMVERMGIDYKALSQRNPKLIYASGSGFGSKGPEATAPAYDYLGQARSGFMTCVGAPGTPPTQTNTGLADQMGGIMLSYAIIAALFDRERTGEGQSVEISHLGSMMWLNMVAVAFKSLIGQELPRFDRYSAPSPLYNHYPCKDGGWVAFSVLQSDRYWPTFCRGVGIEQLEKDPRFENSKARRGNTQELIKILDDIFVTKTADEWISKMKQAGDITITKVQTISELFTDPQVLENDYIVDYDHPVLGKTQLVGFPVAFSRTPANPRDHAPEFGQHTEEVLQQICGYSWEDIEQLKMKNVISAEEKTEKK